MPKKIMVIDDEEDIRSTVETLLKQNGYEVVQAKNAEILRNESSSTFEKRIAREKVGLIDWTVIFLCRCFKSY